MISFYENQYCSSRFPSCLWQLLTSTVLHGSQAVYENYYCSPWFPSCLWRLALFFRFPSCSWEPVLFSMVPKLSMKTSTVLHGSQAVYENQYCRVPQSLQLLYSTLYLSRMNFSSDFFWTVSSKVSLLYTMPKPQNYRWQNGKVGFCIRLHLKLALSRSIEESSSRREGRVSSRWQIV